MKTRRQTVTMRLNKDGTMSMRSTGGFDLRKVLSPEATARLESRDTKQTDRAPVREGRTA